MITNYFCQTETGQEKKDHLYVDLTKDSDKAIIGADNVDESETGGIYLNREQVERLVKQLQNWLGGKSPSPLWEDVG